MASFAVDDLGLDVLFVAMELQLQMHFALHLRQLGFRLHSLDFELLTNFVVSCRANFVQKMVRFYLNLSPKARLILAM